MGDSKIISGFNTAIQTKSEGVGPVSESASQHDWFTLGGTRQTEHVVLGNKTEL